MPNRFPGHAQAQVKDRMAAAVLGVVHIRGWAVHIDGYTRSGALPALVTECDSAPCLTTRGRLLTAYVSVADACSERRFAISAPSGDGYRGGEGRAGHRPRPRGRDRSSPPTAAPGGRPGELPAMVWNTAMIAP